MQVLDFVKLNWIEKIMKKSISSQLKITWNAKLGKIEEVGIHFNDVLV